MKRYKKNCNGGFFVEEGECILCCMPESEAPSLMESDEESCYFTRQPETEEEIIQAIDAIAVSCCSAVKYGGTDEKIIQKILAEPYADSNCIVKASLVDMVMDKFNKVKSSVTKKT